MIKIKLIGYVVLLAAFGCKSKKPHEQTKELEEKTAFYTLEVTRDTLKQLTSYKIINIQIANTKLNYRMDEEKAKEPNFLKIEILDKSNKTIKVITEHPLYKRFDLYSESGQIEAKLISLQKGEVTFRVPYFTEYKKMIISETVNGKLLDKLTLKNEK